MCAKRVVAGMAHLGFVATVGESLTLLVLSQWDQQKPVNVTIINWLYHQGGLPEYWAFGGGRLVEDLQVKWMTDSEGRQRRRWDLDAWTFVHH